MKKLADRTQFEENNPEVILPSNLDTTLDYEDFPPLNNSEPPLKEQCESTENSWAKVASKSSKVADNNFENDRSSVNISLGTNTCLEEMLVSRGFGSKLRGWLQQVVRGGSICIRINDENSNYFKPGKDLRQGTLYPHFSSI